MTGSDNQTAFIRLDFLRDTLAPLLEADGLVYLHCPDWDGCGHFAVVPCEAAFWVCPAHGEPGTQP